MVPVGDNVDFPRVVTFKHVTGVDMVVQYLPVAVEGSVEVPICGVPRWAGVVNEDTAIDPESDRDASKRWLWFVIIPDFSGIPRLWVRERHMR